MVTSPAKSNPSILKRKSKGFTAGLYINPNTCLWDEYFRAQEREEQFHHHLHDTLKRYENLLKLIDLPKLNAGHMHILTEVMDVFGVYPEDLRDLHNYVKDEGEAYRKRNDLTDEVMTEYDEVYNIVENLSPIQRMKLFELYLRDWPEDLYDGRSDYHE